MTQQTTIYVVAYEDGKPCIRDASVGLVAAYLDKSDAMKVAFNLHKTSNRITQVIPVELPESK